MRPSLRTWLAAACLLAVCGCGSSSSTNVTGPTVVRCAVSIEAESITVPATGASGQFAVGANRECTWTASSEVGWVTLTSGATGQGEAQVGYTVAPNPQSTPRQGAIVVNQERVQVEQAAATCRFSITPADASFSSSGGTRDVAVSTQPTCAWTATSDESWITVEPGSGTGSGSVTVRVSDNEGAARSGTVVIARQTFRVSQSAAGSEPEPPVPPEPEPPPPEPAPEPPPPEPEPPAPSCTLQVSPLTLNVPAQAGGATVNVTASDPSCTWTAASNAAWITVSAGNSGSGNGQVALAIAANAETTPRTGTVTVAGKTVTVSQEAAAAPAPPPCSFTIAPASESFGASGGNGRVDVTASDSDCEWTAASSVSWITITSGASSEGNGEVRYTVDGNTTAAARAGTLTVAGQTVNITQEGPAPCTYTVTPTSLSVPSVGQPDASVEVDTAGSCAWTASSPDSWIVITDGATGTGEGRVRFSVLPTTSVTSRTGTLMVAGTTVTVEQEGLLGALLSIEGTIAGLTGICPVLNFAILDQLVRTDGGTTFTGGSCSSLENGREVDVEGTVQGDGALLASLVRRQ